MCWDLLRTICAHDAHDAHDHSLYACCNQQVHDLPHLPQSLINHFAVMAPLSLRWRFWGPRQSFCTAPTCYAAQLQCSRLRKTLTRPANRKPAFHTMCACWCPATKSHWKSCGVLSWLPMTLRCLTGAPLFSKQRTMGLPCYQEGRLREQSSPRCSGIGGSYFRRSFC